MTPPDPAGPSVLGEPTANHPGVEMGRGQVRAAPTSQPNARAARRRADPLAGGPDPRRSWQAPRDQGSTGVPEPRPATCRCGSCAAGSRPQPASEHQHKLDIAAGLGALLVARRLGPDEAMPPSLAPHIGARRPAAYHRLAQAGPGPAARRPRQLKPARRPHPNSTLTQAAA
jgi:hypothetical protein